jgi:hypothetical protein
MTLTRMWNDEVSDEADRTQRSHISRARLGSPLDNGAFQIIPDCLT